MKFSKKLMTAVLAGTMMLSTTAVFAADPAATAGTAKTDMADLAAITVEAAGTVAAPDTISVTLPTKVEFFIDPYNVGGKGQINSAELKVENGSSVAMGVQLTSMATELGADSGITFLTAKPTDATLKTSIKKDVFLYLQKASTDGSYADFNTTTDAKRIVKTGTATAINEDLGTAAKTNGELKLKFQGVVNANDKVTWKGTETVKVSPIFKVYPVAEAPTT